MKRLKNFILLLIAVPVIAFASEEGPSLDKAPVNLSDQASLQRGARMFVNYCLNCHSASSMRYSRMEDLGLTEDQIKENLMFAAEKPGETMTVGMDKKEAKNWLRSARPQRDCPRTRLRLAVYLSAQLLSRRYPSYRLEQRRVPQGGDAARAVEPAG